MTKMTKFSCKIGDFKSCVVLMKDGQAKEVRRGSKTYFRPSDRTYWPSLDAWKATLPAGGVVVIKGGMAEKYATTNPVLSRFLDRARAVRGNRVSTLESQARAKVEMWRSVAARYPAHSYGSYGTHYEKQMVIEEANLREILESGKGGDRLYKDNKTRFFALLPDGNLVGIYYNVEDNMIMSRSDMVKGSHTWTPLTDAEMPIWIQTGNNKMIKI